MEAPRLNRDLPRIEASYKDRPADFWVEERGSYEPSGAGQHLWLRIEKCGLTTPAAVGRLAKALGLPTNRLGYAGLKDARAVTRQWISVDRAPADAEALLGELCGDGGGDPVLGAGGAPGLTVLELTRHRTGLGRGHLLGNRFRIRLRGPATAEPGSLGVVQAGLDVLARRGVPNYFGEQRFGHRGDTARTGAALLAGDFDEALGLVLGRPSAADRGAVLEARERYEAGELRAAREAWPRDQHGPRRLLGALLEGADAAGAFAAMDKRDRYFFGSAFQSELFNDLLARRLELALGGDAAAFDGVWAGDLCLRLPLGRKAFAIEDLAVESARAAAGELTASGPIFGHAMPDPGGRATELEAAVLRDAGLSPAHFEADTARAWPGGRRGLRFPLAEASVRADRDDHGPHLELAFELPKGCYATCVLRELLVEA
ncbi:MAG: tRNA pseudouridine(13) synthase TruD [Planctomycetota bacterium]|nr:tRNA pseudouridine(13) synthase TruD [Planctomycetota bacterium]